MVVSGDLSSKRKYVEARYLSTSNRSTDSLLSENKVWITATVSDLKSFGEEGALKLTNNSFD